MCCFVVYLCSADLSIGVSDIGYTALGPWIAEEILTVQQQIISSGCAQRYPGIFTVINLLWTPGMHHGVTWNQ